MAALSRSAASRAACVCDAAFWRDVRRTHTRQGSDVDARQLYGRWIMANGLAEFVGLTATMALAAGSFTLNDRVSLPVGLLMALGVAALGAAVEGIAVGGAQWWAVRQVLPDLPARDWIVATAIGAFVAWSLGMLPSTLLSSAGAATSSAAAPAAEPPLGLQLLLAAGMGAVLGPFLGVPQWRVLRRVVPRSGRWVLANVVAWAAGMPMIFLATSLIGADDPAWRIAAIVAAGCLMAGLVVGAVHGLWLVRLVRDAGRLSLSTVPEK